MRPPSRASRGSPGSPFPRTSSRRSPSELSRILEWIEQLNEVDTEGVPPMTSVAAMRLAWREDRVTDGGRPEDILANAPERQDGYFVVPKVVE